MPRTRGFGLPRQFLRGFQTVPGCNGDTLSPLPGELFQDFKGLMIVHANRQLKMPAKYATETKDSDHICILRQTYNIRTFL